MTDDALVEESFEIAWNVLDRTGELGDRDWAAKFIAYKIAGMVGKGEKRRLFLTNRAIDLYRRHKLVIVA